VKIAPFRVLLFFVVALAALSRSGWAQYPGPNVNVISPASGSFVGDIFQRQVETDIAASPVNSSRAMAGFIDYQTISTLPPASAWCGYSETNNGGKTWKSNLVPGFPQDSSGQGTSSPLRALGLQQCSDPTLAAAPPNGTDSAQIYFGALGLTQGGLTAAFVVTFQDPDDGSGHFNYIRAVVTDAGNPSFNGQVMDKPSISYDPPSPGFPQGIVHFAWVDFTGTAKNTKFQSKVMYSRSTDGGRTFSGPVKLNGTFGQNQGTAMARLANGTICVVWRTFNAENGFQIVKIDRAGNVSSPATIAGGTNLFPYDQPTLPDAGSPNYAAFRSNAFPTITVDRNGRLLVAWQEYVDSSGLPASPGTGAAPLAIPKIVLTSSIDGITWSQRRVAVNLPNVVQVEPVLKAGGGLLSLFYFDSTNNDKHSQVLNFVPEFQQWIYTGSGVGGDAGIDRRMEVWIAQASLTPDGSAYTNQDVDGTPILSAPVQVSQYLTSTGVDSKGNPLAGVIPGQIMPRTPGFPDLAINLPNVKTTSDGSVPFIGDYIGMAPAVEFLPSNGAWRLALEPGDSAARTFYTVWTDTRSVQFPGFNINGNWGPYDPTNCVNPGTRNTKVFFSAISPGLIARWSGTSRPLQANGTPVPPQFAVTVENTSGANKFFLISIIDNALAEDWSLVQFSPPAPDPGDLNQGFGQILQSASLTFGVFYRPSSTNTTPKLPVVITAQEAMVDGSGNPILDSSGNPTLVPGGLATSLTFTPSGTAISLGSTGLQVLTVHSQSPPKHIAGTGNAGSAQPSDISVQNFGFKNFGFKNFPPEQDVTWSISNQGLLPVSGNAFINASGVQTLLGSGTTDGTYEFNLFVYLTQSSPIYAGCKATQLLQDQVLSNIPITSTSNQQLVTNFGFKNFGFKNFGFKNFGFKNFAPSDISNATFVAGQDGVKLTLRSTTGTPGQFNPTPSVLSEASVAQSVNPLATDPSASFDDVTPPVITVAVTNANTNVPATLGPLGWYRNPVTATWTVVDPGSGVTSPPCEPVTITSGVQMLTCTATNGAGVAADPVSITIRVDTTQPVITPTITGTLGNNGWYRSDVAVYWTVTDPESGISSKPGCDTQTVTNDTTTTGLTFTCSATNGAGLMASKSVTIMKDATLPAINITTPVNNANYLLNANVAANFGCTDAASGVASCTATLNGTPLSNGAKLNTSTVASNRWTFTVTAVDVAGNTAIQTNTYFLIYNFLLSPPKSPANLGSAVPLNWQLKDANGVVISDLTSLTTLKSVFNGQPVNNKCPLSLNGTAPTTLYSPATGATGGSNFRLVSGGYQFNWDTTTANIKGCYTVIFQLKDDAGPAPGFAVLDPARLHLTSVQLQ
jgi:hypothetical protein